MARSKDRQRGDRLPPPGAGQPPERSEEEVEAGEFHSTVDSAAASEEGSLELREERLTARKEMEQVGEVGFRKEVEEVPSRLEVEAYREEVDVEHVPVEKVVRERVDPWEEGDTLIVPVYEEQITVVKRLVMREQIRIRRVGTTERRLVEDTLRKERLRIEDPDHTGLARERYSTGEEFAGDEREEGEPRDEKRGGLLDNMARKILE
jgi:uncharacterized protein (TIGR02271 family)